MKQVRWCRSSLLKTILRVRHETCDLFSNKFFQELTYNADFCYNPIILNFGFTTRFIQWDNKQWLFPNFWHVILHNRCIEHYSKWSDTTKNFIRTGTIRKLKFVQLINSCWIINKRYRILYFSALYAIRIIRINVVSPTKELGKHVT